MKKVLLYFILLMALWLAGIVAWVSVMGLMKIFIGVGTAGLLFFIGVEVSKIIATSAIHTYKKRIHWFYTGLLGIAIVLAMGITSMGMYGYLSNSYKESSDAMGITETRVEIIDTKIDMAEESKISFESQITDSRGRIKNLGEIRSQQEALKDSLYAKGWATHANRANEAIKEAEKNIIKSEVKIDNLIGKISIKNDSISSWKIQILELRQGDEASTDLNTLRYLADITGKSMDWVMQWFILLIIIIGDPMAVLLVIVFNKVVNYKDDEGEEVGTTEAPPLTINDAPPVKVGMTLEEQQDYIINAPWKKVDENLMKEPEAIEESEEEVNKELDKAHLKEVEKNGIRGKIVEQKLLKTEPVVNLLKTEPIDKVIKTEPEKMIDANALLKKSASNQITRIGSNKETRGDDGTIFFKQRNEKS